MAAFKYTAQPKNLIQGSCAKAKAAEKGGALDMAGRPSARKEPGFTRPLASYNAGQYSYEKTEEGSWRCNQDGTLHKTRELCFQKCRKRGLGGPMIVDCIGLGAPSALARQRVGGYAASRRAKAFSTSRPSSTSASVASSGGRCARRCTPEFVALSAR